MKKTSENHAFSVELSNREHLKTLAIPCSVNGNAVIEGFLAKFESATFVKDSMQIQSVNGIIRIDTTSEGFKKLSKPKRQRM